jgi:DNA-binding transcriptional regulator PaaX
MITCPDVALSWDCSESHLVGLTFRAELKSGLGFGFREGFAGVALVRVGAYGSAYGSASENRDFLFRLSTGGVICAESCKKVVLKIARALFDTF